MNLLALIFIGFIWFLWIALSFRADYNKIILLTVGGILEIAGIYLIIQDAITADNEGAKGNIFGNPVALFLVGTGLLIYIVLTVVRLSPDKQVINQT